MSVRRRLEALESRTSGSDSMTIITILGGMPEPYLKTATAGLHRWHQQRDESLDAFRDRAVVSATAYGDRSIKIGGLPASADENGADAEDDHIGDG